MPALKASVAPPRQRHSGLLCSAHREEHALWARQVPTQCNGEEREPKVALPRFETQLPPFVGPRQHLLTGPPED